jgi:hypothetical protein
MGFLPICGGDSGFLACLTRNLGKLPSAIRHRENQENLGQQIGCGCRASSTCMNTLCSSIPVFASSGLNTQDPADLRANTKTQYTSPVEHAAAGIVRTTATQTPEAPWQRQLNSE